MFCTDKLHMLLLLRYEDACTQTTGFYILCLASSRLEGNLVLFIALSLFFPTTCQKQYHSSCKEAWLQGYNTLYQWAINKKKQMSLQQRTNHEQDYTCVDGLQKMERIKHIPQFICWQQFGEHPWQIDSLALQIQETGRESWIMRSREGSPSAKSSVVWHDI